MWIQIFGGVVVLVVFLCRYLRSLTYSQEKLRNRAVLVTGCDSGFGELTALQLDKLGFKVFAGCLLEASVGSLKERASSNLVAFKCDITKQEDIKNAFKIVSAAAPSGLWALINNAGIALVGPIEWLPLDYYRRVMEVNLFGHIAVTSAFLPLLKKTHGRVINVTSVAGLLSAPEMSPYSASKFAFEAYSDALRREMEKWKVDVVMIEPSFMSTAILPNAIKSIATVWNSLPTETKEAYGEEYFADTQNSMTRLNKVSLAPQKVVDTLVHATSAKYPAARYRVGKGSELIMFLASGPSFIADALFRFAATRPVPKALRK